MYWTGLAERFFLLGIKRVCISGNYNIQFPILKKNYPYIDKDVLPFLKDEEYDSFIFFYDENVKAEMMKNYIQGKSHIKKLSEEYHRLLGTILGYPPNAIDFYSSGGFKREPHKRIVLRFCGVECVASVDDLVEDVQWLWEKYPYPDADIVTIQYRYEYVELPYGDVKHVKKIQQQGLRYIQEQITKSS